MKKFVLLGVIVLIMCCGCNYNPIEFHYDFDKVICNYDGDRFELKIDEWTDYDGEQIQVVSDKNTYLLSANKCYMVKEK